MTVRFDEILRPADRERSVSLGDHETHVRIRGEGTPIVLIHSLGLDGRMWDRTAELLARSGAMTISYDVRGHGSTIHAPPAECIDDLVEDLRRLLDELGLTRAAIAGTSMGGVLAQRFSAVHPDPVAGVAFLTSPALGVPAFEERAVAAETDGMASVHAGTLERWFNADLVGKDGPEVRYARSCLDELPLQQWAASWRGIAGFVPPTRDELPDVPVILVAGDADASTPPSLMEQIRARTPGDPEMIVLPGAPHLAVLTHHEAVAEALQKLLQAVGR